ncbi:hypothetical protein FJQ98_15885 [Lysinibacillus agricola]|uniref:Uncharacterized protein n=1 Tax=Lysinibacillus agricola TaxID=2590012 RepID=A0ABX7ALG9_9BACI|nr:MULTISPECIES: hypothetical protein [Lysinibacillus]KOS61571.1 hypothetical protein AN161_18465 [Lysinibacillus sp. FJAT-14222]QQP10725.1 hypothetical protein FJQ98_15885 [Lysinibacillus agricola]
MTILQNAYNAYLSKKYEKEINEFKDYALNKLDKSITNTENNLLRYVTNDHYGYDKIQSEKETLKTLQKLKSCVSGNILSLNINYGEYPVYITYELEEKYNKLNGLIVKGETVQFDENKYKWDLTNTNAATDIINKHFEEVKNIIDEQTNDLAEIKDDNKNNLNGDIDLKAYIQERKDEHMKMIEEEKNKQQEIHDKLMKNIKFTMDYWEKYYKDKLSEIDSNFNISVSINELSQGTKLALKIIKPEALGLSNEEAKMFADIIVDKIKKNKGGLY